MLSNKRGKEASLYPVTLGLIFFPFRLGLGGSTEFALYLSVATGVAAFVLTLLTDHETGVLRVLPYKLHLTVDFIVGLTFLAAPLIFGFAWLDAIYYWMLGVTVVVVVGLHNPMTTADA